jgi:uncharacterized protein (DUF433 family)
MPETTSVVQSDLKMMGGTPVFVGSRLPARFLFEFLADGETIEEFLENFDVPREQVVAAIEEAGKLLVDRANTNRRMRHEETSSPSEGTRVP